MRLLRTSTLEVHEYYGENIPRYAILSHTWGDEEVSFQQLQRMKSDKSVELDALEGGRKIRESCKLAARDRHQYIWIDTCCIDKTSSAELSEAINSMYRWYEESQVCYAYLADVDSADQSEYSLMGQIEGSRWFTRGWTLQELVAPRFVLFYDKAWKEIDTRGFPNFFLSKITGIENDHMIRPSKASVAAKMSWASGRTTTRVEDMAYSLMGLFGVNMPLLYGEGKDAFTRLQHEIVKITDDESIFAWQDESSVESGAFAPSPKAFNLSGDVVNVKFSHLDRPPYAVTHRGLAIELHLEKIMDPDGEDKYLAAIQCAFTKTMSSPILIELTNVDRRNFIRTSAYQLKKDTFPSREAHRCELVYINPIEKFAFGVGNEQASLSSTFYVKTSSLIAYGFSISDTYHCKPQLISGDKKEFKGSWKIEIDLRVRYAGLLLENGNSHPKSAFAIILVVSTRVPQMYVVIPTGPKTLWEILSNQLRQLGQHSDRVRACLQGLIVTAGLRRRNEGCFIDIEISEQQTTSKDSKGLSIR